MIVYEPGMWDRMVQTGQHEELKAWLHANGIDPDDVPIHAEITIEPASRKGTQLIRHTAYLTCDHGHKYYDPATGDAAQEERTVPLVIPPPDALPSGDV